MSLFPATFPQLARPITGKSVESVAFQEKWQTQLPLLIDSLGAAKPESSAKVPGHQAK